MASATLTASKNNVSKSVDLFLLPDAPTLSIVTPANSAIDVPVTGQLTLTFDEDVTVVSGKNIYLKKKSDNTTVQTIAASNAQVSGTTATVSLLGSLEKETEYYVNMDAGAFQNSFSNGNTEITSNTRWSFTTVKNTVSPTADDIYPYYAIASGENNVNV